MNEEKILLALGYSVNDGTINKLRNILSKSDLNESEIDKILALNEKIDMYDSNVMMSNSHDYFKIKIQSSDPKEIEAANEIINAWAKKHKILIKKLENKETYYIISRDK